MRSIFILFLMTITDKHECSSMLLNKRRYRGNLFPVNHKIDWFVSGKHITKQSNSIEPRHISVVMGEDGIKITIEKDDPNDHKIISAKNCGLSDILSSRIINGQLASGGEYPWIVSIEVYGQVMGCAGTIINERWIVSAAHCFKRRNGTVITLIRASSLSIKVGSSDILRGSKYYISDLIIHKKFDNDLMMSSDIALLKTRRAIRMVNQGNINLVNCICLPKRQEEEPQTKSIVVVGWGKLSPKHEFGSQDLMEVSVPLIADRECSGYYRLLIMDDAPKGVTLYSSQICALSRNKDACQGDSGGPAFEYVNGRATLVGIVSYGYGCAEGFPGVYTQVSYFLDWIAQNTK